MVGAGGTRYQLMHVRSNAQDCESAPASAVPSGGSRTSCTRLRIRAGFLAIFLAEKNRRASHLV